MNVKTLVVGAIRANCYLIWNDRACVLIDPGDDADRIHDAVEQTGKPVLTASSFYRIVQNENTKSYRM